MLEAAQIVNFMIAKNKDLIARNMHQFSSVIELITIIHTVG